MYVDESKLPYMSEDEYKNRYVIPRLKKDFWVFEEVDGIDGHKNKIRIDAIIHPKEPDKWAIKNICIGIEFKRRDPNTTAGEFGYMIQQAVTYGQSTFSGNRKINLMLLCPLNLGWGNFSDDQYYEFCKFLDKIPVGTIRWWKPDGDMHIVCCGSVVQWSHKVGVVEGKYNKYRRWHMSKEEKEALKEPQGIITETPY